MSQPQGHYGPYAIVAPIGAGGMGEVYRATDTRLDRTVALKVLPQHVAASAGRRQRFEREARAVSRLSHPNICTLYDVGEQDGVPFLVMEHLDGETLAQRLRRGPIPIREALKYGIDIAAALEHAHRAGIVHRDLKPANIMLTASGAKLLDFGVAALCAPDPVAGSAPAAVRTETEALTEEGTILGTLHYMAPEQLEGRDADARADIFALGAVLYEMATGRQAFGGSSKASVIASILERDPPSLAAAAAEGGTGPSEPLSPLLDHVVARCLAKQPAERWQTVADLRRELQWIADVGLQGTVASAFRTSRRSRLGSPLWIAVAVLFVAAGAAIGALIMARAPNPPARAIQFVISAPELVTFSESSAFLAVSPDGGALAFVAASPEGRRSLWLRRLDSLAARQLPGTEGGSQPFWSPEGRFLAFRAVREGQLRKVGVAGGLPQTIADAQTLHSGAWSPQGVIVFKRSADAGLSRVSAAGGAVTSATALDPSRAEVDHGWPHFLPDGRRFLFVARSRQPEHDGVAYVGSLDSADRVRLVSTDSQVTYAPPGYVMHMRGHTLVAQPFDADTGRVAGEPIVIAEQVERNAGSRRGAFTVSQTGVLAYRPVGQTQLVWFDRSGRRLGTIGPPARYDNPALSPDDRLLAFDRPNPETGTADIWVVELARNITSRLTFNPDADDMPVWSTDGTRIVFRARRTAPDGRLRWSLYEKASSGTGPEQLVPTAPLGPGDAPLAWPQDGRFVVYTAADAAMRRDLWLLPRSAGGTPVRLLETPFNEGQAAASPDGRWLAYVSDESGSNEVYVRPFPSGEARWRISIDGGTEPAWRADGKELYYVARDRYLMAVTMRASTAVDPAPPVRLFETAMASTTNVGYTRNQYVVTGDGQRFLVNQPAGGLPPVTVVVNWPALLKR